MSVKHVVMMVLAAGLVAGCAATPSDSATKRNSAVPSALACANPSGLTRRQRTHCAGLRTMDKSIMEQQIHKCTGEVCGG